MKISKKQLQSIIREELTAHALRPIISGIVKDHARVQRTIGRSPVYIFEGNRRSPQAISFGTLLERRKRGVISERKMVNLWERSVNYQLDQLLTEGFMDSLMDAYETVKGGAIKLKNKISDAAKAAWEKANDLLLNISIQAYNLAQRSVEGVIGAAQKLTAAVGRFKESHPILFKIITVIVIMIIVFGIMSIFSGEAHAAVGTKGAGGSGELSEKSYQALRGALSEYGGQDVQKILDSGEAIKILDKAYQAKETIDITALGKFNQGAYKVVQGLVNDARGGDEVAFELLKKWTKIGANLTVR